MRFGRFAASAGHAAKQLIKRGRALPLLNDVATRSFKRLFDVTGRELDVVVNHLPRVGVAQARLPNGRLLQLWSKGDDFISNQIFWRGWDAHEPETSSLWYELAARSRVIFDVGAHVGVLALIAAHANPEARVFAFEPLPAIFERLERNRALNRLSNLTCIRAAVGETPGTAQLHHTDGIPLSSSLSYEFMRPTPGLRATEVEVLTLDAFAAAHGIDQVDLVKIDTESTEPSVLRGMRSILERSRPDLIIEVLPAQDTALELNAILAPLGYRSQRLVPRTERQRRIAQSVSGITTRPDPFDNYIFTTGPLPRS